MARSIPQSNNRFNWPFSLGQTVGGPGAVLLSGLLLTQSPFVVIGLVVGVAAFAAISRWPELGLYLMVLSVPGQAVTGISLGGSRLTLTQAVVILALAGWSGNRALYQRAFVPRPLPPLLPFFGLYLLTMLVSLTVARSIGDGLSEISRWLITFFAYLLATSVIQTRRQLWRLVACLGAGAVAEAALGIYQRQAKRGPTSFLGCDDPTRACGTFIKPNSYAGYLEMALPLLLALLLLVWFNRTRLTGQWLRGEGQSRPVLRRELLKAYGWLVIVVGAVLVVGWGLVASSSSGAALGLAVTGLVIVILLARRLPLTAMLVGGTLLLGVLGLQTGAIPSSVLGRHSSLEDFAIFDVREVAVNDDNFAIVERLAMWQAGGNMFLSSPWLGVGIGNYNERYPDFSASVWTESRGHAHNYYIHAAAETGLIGLAGYTVLLLAALVGGWRTASRATDPALRLVAWGALGVIIAVAVHNLVEDLHVLNMGIQWSAVLALFYLIQNRSFNQLENTTNRRRRVHWQPPGGRPAGSR